TFSDTPRTRGGGPLVTLKGVSGEEVGGERTRFGRPGDVEAHDERAARGEPWAHAQAVLQAETGAVEVRVPFVVREHTPDVGEEHDPESVRLRERDEVEEPGAHLEVAEQLEHAVVALRRDAAHTLGPSECRGVVEARELVKRWIAEEGVGDEPSSEREAPWKNRSIAARREVEPPVPMRGSPERAGGEVDAQRVIRTLERRR